MGKITDEWEIKKRQKEEKEKVINENGKNHAHKKNWDKWCTHWLIRAIVKKIEWFSLI